jgi:hypothetical protein
MQPTLVLHSALCTGAVGQLPGGASSKPSGKQGETRGGKYFHRILAGYGKDQRPEYRYFHTKEEWDSYLDHKGGKSGEKKGKKDKKSKDRLKEKLDKEHNKKKQSLFVKKKADKEKEKKVEKGLFINL